MRPCRICGESTPIRAGNDQTSQVMFYEGLCRTCAAGVIDDVIMEDVRLTEVGVAVLYSGEGVREMLMVRETVMGGSFAHG